MSIFQQIIEGNIPAYKIAENENFLAFLDIFPLVKGHVLVIPKLGIDKFYHINNDLLSEWLVFAKPICHAIEKAFPCKRVGLSIVGIEVAHAHIHLIPINQVDDMNFSKAKLSLSPGEFAEIQQAIMAHL